MTNAVLFGIGIVTVLNVPSLAAHAGIGIPVVVVFSLLLAAPIAWFIAPVCAPAIGGEGMSRHATGCPLTASARIPRKGPAAFSLLELDRRRSDNAPCRC